MLVFRDSKQNNFVCYYWDFYFALAVWVGVVILNSLVHSFGTSFLYKFFFTYPKKIKKQKFFFLFIMMFFLMGRSG